MPGEVGRWLVTVVIGTWGWPLVGLSARRGPLTRRPTTRQNDAERGATIRPDHWHLRDANPGSASIDVVNVAAAQTRHRSVVCERSGLQAEFPHPYIDQLLHQTLRKRLIDGEPQRTR